MVYGGTIRPGHLAQPGNGSMQKLDIISAFEAYGHYLAADIDEEQMREVLRNACPGEGACGGMYTANTMASAIESLGMSLPYSSSYPASSEGKQQECLEAGAAIRNLLELDLKPLDILTRQAFENSITVTIALGGSTNAVLHLIAIAKATNVQLTIDDFQEISDRTPLLADLKPSGQFVMEDLYEVGGVPAVQKMLLREGFLHGDCMTVTGKTLAENLADVPDLSEGQKVIMPVENPIKETGHLQILYGNLAETGAVAKITGKEGLRFSGPAVCYDSEEDCLAGIESDEVLPGNVVVIRYEGPKGGAGHARDAQHHRRHNGQGAGQGCCADNRWPLLRRQPRFRRRPHHARGTGRRPARTSEKRRHHHDRRREQCADTRGYRRRNRAPPGVLERARVQGQERRPLEVHQDSVERFGRLRDRRLSADYAGYIRLKVSQEINS